MTILRGDVTEQRNISGMLNEVTRPIYLNKNDLHLKTPTECSTYNKVVMRGLG